MQNAWPEHEPAGLSGAVGTRRAPITTASCKVKMERQHTACVNITAAPAVVKDMKRKKRENERRKEEQPQLCKQPAIMLSYKASLQESPELLESEQASITAASWK
jgi:hypothetical protein